MPIFVNKNFKTFSKIFFILYSKSYLAVQDVHISKQQAYTRILVYLKLLKTTYVSILEFDESKHVIKFWSMEVCMNAI